MAKKEILYVDYRPSPDVHHRIGRIEKKESSFLIEYYDTGKWNTAPSDASSDIEAAHQLLQLWRHIESQKTSDCLLRYRMRFKELAAPDVRRVMPYLTFHCMSGWPEPSSHKLLNGGVAPIEWWEEEGKNYFPPIGLACLCVLSGLTKDGARRRIQEGQGFDLTSEFPLGVQPDPKWQAWVQTFDETWESLKKDGVNDVNARAGAVSKACETLRETLAEVLPFIELNKS